MVVPSQKEIESVESLSARGRYDHFIKRVADQEGIWGLYSDGWATSACPDGSTAIPFWPAEAYAARNATDDWSGYSPRQISIEAFLDDLAIEARKQGYSASVFYVEGKGGVSVSWEELLTDLRLELERY